MARGDKPYRVYRGGRVKGRVPLATRPEKPRRRDGPKPVRAARAPAPRKSPRRRRSWGRRIWIGILALFVALVAWAVASYLALSASVQDANKRLGPAALVPQDGLLLSNPTTVMLVGIDHASRADRRGSRRADSLLLVRTDPSRHRLSYLSIPRDLRVDVPGYGSMKVNAAYQLGGPRLTSRTVRAFTGLPVHHMVVVDFGNFERLIDAIGGIDVTVPEPIVSNRFECPYSPERCLRWEGWRFSAGRHHMDGRRALIYSRIRENRLNPAENDLTRGERQQAVLQAMTSRLLSPVTLAKLPLIADDLMAPLATDFTAGQLFQLGWLRFRSSPDRTLHCRLGGEASSIGGESFLIASEENREVISMFTGRSAPQPPKPGSGPFGPGCVVGSATIR
jgi:polyisoprenyl-teichoic acid--peptidoglycan teichoic acid transferase